jgi:hypothetical protein
MSIGARKIGGDIPAIFAMIVGMPHGCAKAETETVPPAPEADDAICIHMVSAMLLVITISTYGLKLRKKGVRRAGAGG